MALSTAGYPDFTCAPDHAFRHIFDDHGVSGSRDSRPGLDKMLRILEPGDTVVVFKLDRLGRSMLHLADLLERFKKTDIHFCSVAEGINTTTPGGKLIFHIFSAIAEFQRDIIVENTHAGLEAARKRGKRLGRPPLLSIDDIVTAHYRLVKHGDAIARLAQELGVSRMTLARGFDKLGLDAC
ncbi:MAG: recombinase family protein [Pseudomonadota bacterium]